MGTSVCGPYSASELYKFQKLFTLRVGFGVSFKGQMLERKACCVGNYLSSFVKVFRAIEYGIRTTELLGSYLTNSLSGVFLL